MIKICSKCKKKDLLTNFPPNKSRADGRCNYCRSCYTTVHREYYRNRSKVDSDFRERKIKQRSDYQKAGSSKIKDYILLYLQNNSCVMCGESDILVLEFDHLNPKDKCFNIGESTNNRYPLFKVIEEINKCQVLCSNCHRRKTIKDLNFWKGRV